jgi:predicted CXXCH cytochrome family protein
VKRMSKPLITSLSLLAMAFLTVTAAGFRGRGIEQPLPFNHRTHIEEAGLECTDCHLYVESAAYAGRPSLGICANCHEEAMTESSAEATLLEYIGSGREIPWKRLYTVPSHVYYSHRRHVSVAKLDCIECHGDIANTSSPPAKPLKRLSMNFCMDCHEREGASTDCNACHM